VAATLKKDPAKAPAAPGLSDAAVKANTGKTWAQWVKVLDAAGGRKLTHRELVAVVAGAHGIGPWWQQMVVVGYEKLTGKRQTHERTDGYSISASRTFGVGVAKAYAVLSSPAQLKRLLPEATLVLTSTTRNKYVRGRCAGDGSRLEMNFYSKGASKCQVTVQQHKLKTAAEGERRKQFWKERLGALAARLEG
jgi:hypothetical protein